MTAELIANHKVGTLATTKMHAQKSGSEKLKKKLSKGLIGIIAAGSIFLGITSLKGFDNVENQLKGYDCYVTAMQRNEAITEIITARNELIYKNDGETIRHPDPLKAKNLIYIAEQRIEDRYLIGQLNNVYSSLPSENNLRDYAGSRVNNKTFASQRDSLDSVAISIESEKDILLSRVPQDLLSRKNKSIAGLVLSGAGLAGLLGFGLYKSIRLEMY